jgi:1-phosphofructokinase family hexose kinase
VIVCVTPNPALDRIMTIPGFQAGRVFRPMAQVTAAGGKGVNVARALHTLGGESVCAGFLGGQTGQRLAELIAQEGLLGAWTEITGETRTCTIIADPEGEATVINEHGPTVSADDWARLKTDILQTAAGAAVICFSGSLPPESPVGAFADLLQRLRAEGREVWVDSSGEPLVAAVKISGVHIKVNADEAGAVLRRPVTDFVTAVAAAEEIGNRVGGSVALTLGKQGAVLVHKGGCWLAYPPTIKAVSNVGSGDSFLAGLVQALQTKCAPDVALRRAVAAGTANALSLGGGVFTSKEYKQILKATTVQAF